jgi:hypothetical protein
MGRKGVVDGEVDLGLGEVRGSTRVGRKAGGGGEEAPRR